MLNLYNHLIYVSVLDVYNVLINYLNFISISILHLPWPPILISHLLYRHPDVEPSQSFVLDVYNVLINLDHNKAQGINGIGPKVLKYCAESL